MAYGDRKHRGPEEQGLDASYPRRPFTGTLKFTRVEETRFERLASLGWPDAHW
jgi:hypothetical protein